MKTNISGANIEMSRVNLNGLDQTSKEFLIYGTNDKVFAEELFKELGQSISQTRDHFVIRDYFGMYLNNNIAVDMSSNPADIFRSEASFYSKEELHKHNYGNNLNTFVSVNNQEERYLIARTHKTVKMFGFRSAHEYVDSGNSGLLNFYSSAAKLFEQLRMESIAKFDRTDIERFNTEKARFIIDVKKSDTAFGMFEVNARTINSSVRIIVTFLMPVVSEYNNNKHPLILDASQEDVVKRDIIQAVDFVLNGNDSSKHLDKFRLDIYNSVPIYAVDPLNNYSTRKALFSALKNENRHKDLFLIAKAVNDNSEYFGRFVHAISNQSLALLPVDKKEIPTKFFDSLHDSEPTGAKGAIKSNTDLAAEIFNTMIINSHKSINIETTTRAAILIAITLNVMTESARKELAIAYGEINSASTINSLKTLVRNKVDNEKLSLVLASAVKQFDTTLENYDNVAKQLLNKCILQSLINIKDAFSANLFIDNKTVYTGPESREDKLTLISAINNIVYNQEEMTFSLLNPNNTRRDAMHLSRAIIHALHKYIGICKSKFFVDYKLVTEELITEEKEILLNLNGMKIEVEVGRFIYLDVKQDCSIKVVVENDDTDLATDEK